MQRPKWLSSWGKGKSTLEGSLVIDIPDIKVVEATSNNKIVLIAIGLSQQQAKTPLIKENADEIAAKPMTQKVLEWKIFYDSAALLNLVPNEKARDFMAGTVAVVSGNSAVFDSSTVYVASGDRPAKGNAPLLLDYEIAKKLEEAKRKTD